MNEENLHKMSATKKIKQMDTLDYAYSRWGHFKLCDQDRPEGSERVNVARIWRNRGCSRGNCRCEGPEAGMSVGCDWRAEKAEWMEMRLERQADYQ